MSTIASPRDPSTPLARRMNSSTGIPTTTTPTSSTRPSLDLRPTTSSTTSSPKLASQPTVPTIITTSSSTAASSSSSKRATRAALREYYNIKKQQHQQQQQSQPSTPSLELPPQHHPPPDTLVSSSELDDPTFDPQSFISQTLENASLAQLLQTYTRVLGEMRALDAEKKALVYDNYSKLISATETIRRMQSTMDPLNPVAGTLDVVVARVYEMAARAREGLREEIIPRTEDGDGNRKRTRELAREVLSVPGRLRRLVEEGKEEEARREWVMPRRLLERWRERGVGGEEVGALMEEGDAIVGFAGGGGDEGSQTSGKERSF
ncbi:Vps51/Vps67-domain-containing protein [Echria macrotheca]|uniref:Vacuolar protein sorting-associated protein 51 homolog n=1 Tax=Echria macrotheca TaxID=438768 RepID=A0AAJ0FD63_9PEZI|nr:Vps51/Vps67-domain-containing protein [Echria macrotheca]